MSEHPREVRRGERPSAAKFNALAAALRQVRLFVRWPLRLRRTSSAVVLSTDPNWGKRRFAKIISGPAGDSSYTIQRVNRNANTHAWVPFGANIKAWEFLNTTAIPAGQIVELINTNNAERIFQLATC